VTTDHPILVFPKASAVPVVDPSHCGGRGGGNDSSALRRFVNENANQNTNFYQSRTPRAGPATVDPHAAILVVRVDAVRQVGEDLAHRGRGLMVEGEWVAAPRATEATTWIQSALFAGCPIQPAPEAVERSVRPWPVRSGPRRQRTPAGSSGRPSR
jgi:hypothetical protein